tara:strand:+ start:183 stop:344 length:162 start_codon:yes stop_codon:yes gene_type:complete
MSIDISVDPVLYAESVLSWCGRDIDRSIAAVQVTNIDKFFKLAVVHELEKRRV